jgi:RecJ-like exonuclease
MSSCIICGTSTEGRICDLHEEDVVFEFTGTSADELTPNRYYRGTVDGFAEFGVFVDIGDHITGLLHRSELDQRLDALDWDAGDSVYVQVKNVRDNGNIDLGWSIRQSESEFRGTLIDDPDADGPRLAEEDQSEAEAEAQTAPEVTPKPDTPGKEREEGNEHAGAGDAEAATGSPDEEASGPDEDATAAVATAGGTTEAAPEQTTERTFDEVTIDSLGDYVGEHVRIEGEITDARQTSGPTIFQLTDETGTVDVAAFEEAGVRAYPEAEEGDVVRIEGEVERRRGELQVETEALVRLDAEAAAAFDERLEDAMVQRARPESQDPLADDPAVATVADEIVDAATAIRRAVLEGRPIVVRHSATADGYAAGVALERATLPLIAEEHSQAAAAYHYFDRRPMEGGVYDLDDATKDVTTMLENEQRHDELIPLFVFAAAGGTRESGDGFELLDLYGARRVVIDEREADPEVADTVDTLVSPAQANGGETTATALAANVAVHVEPAVREDLAHLPAVSFWTDTPEGYADLAREADVDADTAREIREAIALEAYYQSYEDKRELIGDLLFADEGEAGGLAGHVSEQFRSKLDTERETAEANLESVTHDGLDALVLDAEAYTHGYEFPPTELLVDDLHRRHVDVDALLALDTDELHLRTDADVDIHQLVDDAAMAAPTAGLDAKSAREGRIEYLAGEREAVREAILAALADAI